MTRTLSSPGNFFWTRLFPAVWITGFGIGALWLSVSPKTMPWNGVPGAAPPWAGPVLLLGWLGGTAFLLLLSWGLKRVRLSASTLLISNYRREVAIPLAEVASVRQRLFPHFGSITVEFRSETPFGRAVTFIPGGRTARWFGEEGEVIQELRSAVARATQSSPAA
jgi:hypothetical protein